MFVFDLLKIADIFKIQKNVFDFINNDVHNDTFVLITHMLKNSIFQRPELQNLEWTRQRRWCKNIEPVLLWHHLHKLSLNFKMKTSNIDKKPYRKMILAMM